MGSEGNRGAIKTQRGVRTSDGEEVKRLAIKDRSMLIRLFKELIFEEKYNEAAIDPQSPEL